MPECPGALQYAQMRDGAMIRLRFPGGTVTSAQLKALAKLSAQRGNGLIDLTNRANLQIRGLDPTSPTTLFSLEKLLRTENILAEQLWADRLRNIMADPLCNKAGAALIDTSPLVIALDQLLQNSPSLKALSPKFCFIVDNGSPLHLASHPHDLALIAEKHEGQTKMRLSIANKLTSLTVLPFQGAELLVRIANLICQSKGKFKRASDLVDQLGLEQAGLKIRALYPLCTNSLQTARQHPSQKPPIGWIAQSNPDLSLLGLQVPVSRLSSEQLHWLGEMSEKYGSNAIRLSPWQIVYLPDIPTDKREKIQKQAQNHGFFLSGKSLQTQLFACSGSTGCPRTQADCKQEGQSLTALIETTHTALLATALPAKTIHISGCDRGCAFAGRADILALAETDGSGYTVFEHKSLADIRKQTDKQDKPVLFSNNIVQELMKRIAQ